MKTPKLLDIDLQGAKEKLLQVKEAYKFRLQNRLKAIKSINFVPLGIPWEARLEMLAAGLVVTFMIFGGGIAITFMAYIILYTHHWPEALIYLLWAWVVDVNISEKGGRRFEWVRNWTWWYYLKNYFPIHMHRLPWVELDPKKNYLFCCFPHGILPMGAFSTFATNYSDFNDYFPHHKSHILTLKVNFLFPIIRELLLALGACSASKRSLNSILGDPEGGQVAALVIGGAEEAFYCRPGQYHIVLEKRKGFVKLALTHGTPLVPVLSFGETDIYDQLDNPKGSRTRQVQDWVKKVTGVAPIIPLGRGYFQYSYGMVPYRKPITVLVGKPLPTERIAYPTQEQIDHYHKLFMDQLIEMFEEQKHNYLSNAEETKLVIS